MTHNAKIFRDKLIEKSEHPTYDKAKQEWECVECYIAEDGATCLCSKTPIKYVMVFENKFNRNKIPVGNVCSQTHFGTNFNDEKYVIEKRKLHEKNRKKYYKELQHVSIIKKKGNSWEKDFATSIERIYLNGWNMSTKQKLCWDKILKKHIGIEKQIVNDKHIDFSPITFDDKNKEMVQREAYNYWITYGKKGTLEMATGVGKTYIGLMAIQQHPDDKVYVVVPKIDLQKQWVDELKNVLNIPEEKIGRVGNGYKEFDKQIIVAVVNSLRDEYLTGGLLIADEMHRYGAPENFSFIYNGDFRKILGLTATYRRTDGAEKMLSDYAPVIYRFSQKEAIDKNLLIGFELLNVQVPLTVEERTLHSKIKNFISQNFPLFGNNFDEVRRGVRMGGVMGDIASDLLRSFTKRRQILLNSENKIKKAVDIIEKETGKVLVFSEYIKTADKIMKELKERGIKCGKYHSGMGGKKKKEMLDDFKDSKLRVMVSVKSLDEGTNIPDCEVAIIVGGTSVKRQMVQRLGRILRTYEGKKRAKVYQLYIPNTKDYDWMKKRLSALKDNAENVRWI